MAKKHGGARHSPYPHHDQASPAPPQQIEEALPPLGPPVHQQQPVHWTPRSPTAGETAPPSPPPTHTHHHLPPEGHPPPSPHYYPQVDRVEVYAYQPPPSPSYQRPPSPVVYHPSPLHHIPHRTKVEMEGEERVVEVHIPDPHHLHHRPLHHSPPPHHSPQSPHHYHHIPITYVYNGELEGILLGI